MIEHNNRKIADAHAEFITSKQLRKLVADKVSEYLGNSPVSVFDGAAGSGQMEEYINIKHLTGVDIQPEAISALEANFGDKCVVIVAGIGINLHASVCAACCAFSSCVEEVEFG